MAGLPATPRQPITVVEMTDQDVVEQVANLLCVNTISSKPQTDRTKSQYRAMLTGGAAFSFMQLVKPLMGRRRQEQMEQAIACYAPKHLYPHRTYHLTTAFQEECDRYWLAGYMEGEAYFGCRIDKRGSRIYCSPRVTVACIDRDVIVRTRNIWQLLYHIEVNLIEKRPQLPQWSPSYYIEAHGDAALAIMNNLYQLLGQRRQLKIREVMDKVSNTHLTVNI